MSQIDPPRTPRSNLTPIEQAALVKLEQLRADGQRWFQQSLGLPPRVVDGSDLASDDALTDPWLLSATASQRINIAVDNFDALLGSIHSVDADGRLGITTRPYALAPLIRASFETACSAVWLLGPDRSSERAARALALAFRDAKHQLDGASALKRDADSRNLVAASTLSTIPELKAAYALEVAEIRSAIAARVAPADSVNASTGHTRIVRDAGVLSGFGEDRAEWVWSALSGASHGQQWAINSLSSVEVVDQHAGDRVTATWTLNLPTAVGLCSYAHEMISHARRIWALRNSPRSA